MLRKKNIYLRCTSLKKRTKLHRYILLQNRRIVMGNILFNLSCPHLIFLDWSHTICTQITFYISRMDVFISRWLEKTFDFTQDVACNIAGFMLFTSFGQQNQKWKTFIVSISRIFANTAITFCQRNRPKVGVQFKEGGVGALCVQMDFMRTFQTNAKCNNTQKFLDALTVNSKYLH